MSDNKIKIKDLQNRDDNFGKLNTIIDDGVVTYKAKLNDIFGGEEEVRATVINELYGRIEALENVIRSGLVDVLQIETADIQNLKLYGSEFILIDSGAPSVIPDFIGQFYVNTANSTIYMAATTTSGG